jgi:anti-sigma B factor antagonist
MSEINKKYIGEGADKSVIFEVDEEIVGLNQFNALNDSVNDEMKIGIRSFTFDLTTLNSINSSGLGILISCLKKVKDSDSTLKIVNVNEKVMSIFKLTKLDNIFDLHTSA